MRQNGVQKFNGKENRSDRKNQSNQPSEIYLAGKEQKSAKINTNSMQATSVQQNGLDFKIGSPSVGKNEKFGSSKSVKFQKCGKNSSTPQYIPVIPNTLFHLDDRYGFVSMHYHDPSTFLGQLFTIDSNGRYSSYHLYEYIPSQRRDRKAALSASTVPYRGLQLCESSLNVGTGSPSVGKNKKFGTPKRIPNIFFRLDDIYGFVSVFTHDPLSFPGQLFTIDTEGRYSSYHLYQLKIILFLTRVLLNFLY